MKVEQKIIPLSKIKLNKNNPRFIKDDKYKSLLKSLKEFPEMLELREIVVDEDMIILGGNMRYRALKELKVKKVNVKIVSGLSDEQKKEFIVKDNVGFGEWDWDLLANDWDAELLSEWGLDIDIDIEKISIENDMSAEDIKFMTQVNHIRDSVAKDMKGKEGLELVDAMILAESSILKSLHNEYITN